MRGKMKTYNYFDFIRCDSCPLVALCPDDKSKMKDGKRACPLVEMIDEKETNR